MKNYSDYSDYLKKILTSRVYEAAVETPLDKAKNLSARLGNEIYIKREDQQPVFSFKIRGAYNKIASLTPSERARGVIAASAGNHAQGVALSAKKLGCKATIVMPATTPKIKVDAVKALGGEVVLAGESYTDAYNHLLGMIKETGMVFIPPFDDPMVIAGQGTIGMEILRQAPRPVEAVFVPIGGGGMAAGVAAYVKSVMPEVKVIGVQTLDSPGMHDSIKNGRVTVMKEVGLFADGTAVKQVGEETFRICKDLLDEVLLVSIDEVCSAIKDTFEDTRVLAEPSGALSLAGLKAYARREGLKGKVLVSVNSGANINFHRLRHVSERTELSEGKESVLAVTIPERPGSFLGFIRMIKDRSVTEFNYRYGDRSDAHIFVGVETQGLEDRQKLIQGLVDGGMPVTDLTDDEVAKLHIRYMVGGRAPEVDNERVFTFEFPEAPGALHRFLEDLRTRWSITLFHYRNHGADYGRILVGISVPPKDNADLDAFLNRSGYVHREFTDNPGYKMFLGGD